MLHNYEYRYLSIYMRVYIYIYIHIYIYIVSGNCHRFFQPAMFVDLRVSWPNASHAHNVSSCWQAEKYVTSAYVTAIKRAGRSIHDDVGSLSGSVGHNMPQTGCCGSPAGAPQRSFIVTYCDPRQQFEMKHDRIVLNLLMAIEPRSKPLCSC